MLPYIDKLAKDQYDITLISTFSSEQYQVFSREYKCINLQLERGFHLIKTISCIKSLYQKFRDGNYQVIEYGTANVSLCAAIAGWLAGVPVRIYNHWGSLFTGHTGVQRAVVKNIEKIISLLSTDIRDVSHRNMQMCINEHIYPPSKVKVLGLGGTVGVDFAKFDLNNKQINRVEVRKKYSIPDNTFVFGFVGRINRDKGVNELIDAFRSLNSTHQSAVHLMLVGNIDKNKPIEEERINWARQSPQVTLTGQVDNTAEYMSSFDILIHPTYREGFGMVLQEAAALKVPIITSDIIGPGEFIQHNKTGLLVPPRDPDSLRHAMNEFLETPEKYKQFAENCYIYTEENFERSIMVERILKDRVEILKSHGIV